MSITKYSSCTFRGPFRENSDSDFDADLISGDRFSVHASNSEHGRSSFGNKDDTMAFVLR